MIVQLPSVAPAALLPPDQASALSSGLTGWFPRTKMIYRASVCFSIQATKIN